MRVLLQCIPNFDTNQVELHFVWLNTSILFWHSIHKLSFQYNFFWILELNSIINGPLTDAYKHIRAKKLNAYSVSSSRLEKVFYSDMGGLNLSHFCKHFLF